VPLYTSDFPFWLPFTYPPVSAVLFGVLAVPPFVAAAALLAVAGLVSLSMTTGLAVGGAAGGGGRRVGGVPGGVVPPLGVDRPGHRLGGTGTRRRRVLCRASRSCSRSTTAFSHTGATANWGGCGGNTSWVTAAY
jgi:hypothetical protein